jgi:hypothetical protein
VTNCHGTGAAPGVRWMIWPVTALRGERFSEDCAYAMHAKE